MPSSTEIAFARGLEAHQNGKLAAADAIYREILAADPRHADAWHLSGVILLQRGNAAGALDRIQQAISLRAQNPFYHNNRGLALRALGRKAEAAADFRRALELNPEYFEAWLNLGNLNRDQADAPAAAECYRRAAALRPRDTGLINNMGGLAGDEGREADAEALFRRALAIDPRQAGAWSNLGLSLLRQDRVNEAREALLKGLANAPRDPELLTNFAGAAQRSGQVQEAEDAYRHVLQIAPAHAAAHGNYGSFLRERGRLVEAAEHLRTAIALQPGQAEFYNNLGLVLQAGGQLQPAMQLFQQSLQLRPGHARAWNNLGIARWTAGDQRGALEAYERAEELRPGFHDAGSNRLLALHYTSDFSPTDIYERHGAWANRYARSFYPASRRKLRPRAGRRIRVGYVSPDFRSHAVGHFIAPVLRAHDRGRFEVFAYSDVLAADASTAVFSRLAEHWVPVAALNDQEFARRVENDDIDILVDLAGHTARNRLIAFARGPAPIQASFLGYPNTTGLATMDYRLTDALADPPGQTEQWHMERLSRLPRTAWCYQPAPDAPAVSSAPAQRKGPFTFGCFNNFAKISPEVFTLWSRILNGVPDSRFVLKSLALGDSALRETTWQRFAAAGIARERVELIGWDPEPQAHLLRYGKIDLALDTYPYHGTTTTCDALWMGVPVVTLAGASHVSRVGVSLLTNAGLTEFVTRDRADYVACALRWAGRLDELNDLRGRLRASLAGSPLCDAVGCTRALETIYSEWTSGTPAPSL